MTDHEMNLLAAKAAGYTVEVGTPDNPWLLRTGEDGITYWWNPLAQGDQTFELMVDCGLTAMMLSDSAMAHSSECRFAADEDYGADKHAATKRAIVRAAAAMGDK